MRGLCAWMFISKFIKLLGHYIRYPVDFVLLPVSILFGYLHGLIKVYAAWTLNVTTWGSREGADENDKDRMRQKVEAGDYSLLEKARMLESFGGADNATDVVFRKHHHSGFLQRTQFAGLMNVNAPRTCQLA
ncbi:hypothetical protein KEM55_000714 [Ascosphaera atra]|nr:hypothetical protein KEM55_000714 [Ascosphaera atra]